MRFLHSSFARNAVIMMTGTALAQSVSIAVAPILTRLYSPSDYGVFAVYTSASSLVAVLAGGKYDVATIFAKDDEEAMNLVGLTVVVTTMLAGCTAGLVVLFGHSIALMLGNAALQPWLYLVPITLMVIGIYRGMYSFANRLGYFNKLSQGKVCGAVAGASTTVGLGLLCAEAGGLILGSILNQAVATAILVKQLWKGFYQKRNQLVGRVMKMVAVQHYRLPLYSLPAEFVNVAAQQIPVLLLANFFGSMVVGYFSLTQRVLGLPIGLISDSILEVFRQRASIDFNLNGDCRSIFVKTLKGLIAVCIVPFGIFFLAAPWLFAVVFGKEWEVAGEYARIMTPLFFLRFVTRPLSYIFYLADKQHVDLAGNVALFALALAAIAVGGAAKDAQLGILLFSAAYSVTYLAYLGLSYYYSSGRKVSVV